MLDERAKETLQIHAGHLVVDGRQSLVGDLRPFVGCDEPSFAEVLKALVDTHDEFGQEKLDRELVYAAFDIPYRIRKLLPTLGRRKLVDNVTAKCLDNWSSIVEEYCMRSMNGSGQLVALSGFMSYVASDICRSPQVYVPLLATLRESPSDDVLDLEQDRLKAIEAIEG